LRYVSPELGHQRPGSVSVGALVVSQFENGQC